LLLPAVVALPKSATYILLDCVECTKTGADPGGRLIVVTVPVPLT
jgi:hypothetical protein